MSSLLLRQSRATVSAARCISTGHLTRCARGSGRMVHHTALDYNRWHESSTLRQRATIAPFSSNGYISSVHCSPFSSLVADYEDQDDDEPVLPTRHSSKLPPKVCHPSLLRSEVESLFNAPIGSLITYQPHEKKHQLRSVQEEIEHAYYASDAVVQRVEYLLRGLNAQVSNESYVTKAVSQGVMAMDAGNGENTLSRQECFRVMMDLINRMDEEGQAFVEMRKRVRSQLEGVSSRTSSDGSSSSSSDSSDDEDDDVDEESLNKFTQYTEDRMRSAGFSTRDKSSSTSGTNPVSSDEDSNDEEIQLNPEDYQFGAPPGLTVHMYDLLLDALACLCKEQYSPNGPGDVDLIDLMGEESPPEFAKDILDGVLNTHWMDGGDIGLGSAADANNALNKIAQGIGVGAGTGAGSLAHYTAMKFDVRTCPTPMTFNAVLRIAAEFDYKAHATMVENAKVLSGTSLKRTKNDEKQLKMEQERLRDITIDAAFSTFTRMKHCAAMTLRSIKNSTKNATSRSALKRQAKMLELGKTSTKSRDIISGRNSATYSYLLQTVKNCVPASISRGNIAFGLYHKACVQEGVMDYALVKTMMGMGGYNNDEISDGDGTKTGEITAPPPPISNGPLFDNFMQQELGTGAAVALEKGRQLRQDRNYKLRRHVDWDDTY
ncbi:hypothetical protein HJC23_008335 [Cyclotella cryptica]|uniref:Uncharacterized protein n=1 Tax=Cyclotella cryptica TaxID=29204 RepID=A0ABD3Q4Z8_9STRA|eukprot:CCRYP_008624-RA/>CCRYP_008624-RA protein AED:0.42 eAED:0.42 QI:0/-1/0/1/-1/1/1/0/659